MNIWTINAYRYVTSLPFILWTECVSLRTKLARRLSLKINTYRGYLYGLSDSLGSEINVEVNPENVMEGAVGPYTDPRVKSLFINSRLRASCQIITKSDISYIWTATLRKSGVISESQKVHTVPFKWHQGLKMDEQQALTTLCHLGIGTTKLGLGNRSKIVSSLLYAFISCIENTNLETTVIGVSFPATTQGGIKNTQVFCRGASYSAKTVTSILLKLTEGGWIIKRAGFRGKDNFSGVTTIWTPTEKLADYINELFDEARLDSYRDKHANVELRDPFDDRTVPLERTLVRDLSNQVSMVQEVLNSVFWAYLKKGRWVDLQPVELELTRKFKFDYNSGGRLYCIAQNLSKDARRTLAINGNPTVELDFKSLHPTMLYHLAQLEAPEDCYQILNTKREDIKQTLLTALNAKTRQRAKQSIVNTLEVKHDEAERLMKACEVLHEPIAQHFYRSSWRMLQYLDSLITMDTLSYLASHGVPALPIHDSYIVEAKHEGRLKEAMSCAYKNHMSNFISTIE
jgi:hypothetical protein